MGNHPHSPPTPQSIPTPEPGLVPLLTCGSDHIPLSHSHYQLRLPSALGGHRPLHQATSYRFSLINPTLPPSSSGNYPSTPYSSHPKQLTAPQLHMLPLLPWHNFVDSANSCHSFKTSSGASSSGTSSLISPPPTNLNELIALSLF